MYILMYESKGSKNSLPLFQWSTPSEVLQSYQAQELWIAPPQFYELSRMCRLPLLNDLHNFSNLRATEGCEQWLPVLHTKDENYISLLPGTDSVDCTSRPAAKYAQLSFHESVISHSEVHGPLGSLEGTQWPSGKTESFRISIHN